MQLTQFLKSISLMALGLFVSTSASAADEVVSLARWGEPGLQQMLSAAKRVPTYHVDRLKTLSALYNAKCAAIKDTGCFLTEKEAGLGSAMNRVVLFRGEPGQFDLPMTAPMMRDVLTGHPLCGERCTSKSLTANMHRLISMLIPYVAKQRPRFYGGHTFSQEHGEWQLEPNANALFTTERKPSVLDVLVNSHFRGFLQVLKFNHSDFNRREGILDPFVSFSASPEIAFKFSHSFEEDGQIWMISVPVQELEVYHGGKCGRMMNEVGLYDLQRCSRPRIYNGEREYDVYLYVPSQYIVGKIRQENR